MMTKKSTYQPALSPWWWLKHRHFAGYMLREATVLPLAFFLGCVVGGLYQWYQGPAAFAHWQAFMATPWVLALNMLACLASVWHAATFFRLFPRVMPLRFGAWQVPARLLVLGQWLGMLLVLVALTLVLRVVAYG